jgi:hypothetical protein
MCRHSLLDLRELDLSLASRSMNALRSLATVQVMGSVFGSLTVMLTIKHRTSRLSGLRKIVVSGTVILAWGRSGDVISIRGGSATVLSGV